MTSDSTEQEAFWTGEFGNEYTARNQGPILHASNVSFFSKVVGRTGPLRSVLELGANRGLNLNALRVLLPDCEFSAVEINPSAAAILEQSGVVTHRGSITGFRIERTYELTFTKGVLIHIAPESLLSAYDTLYSCSSRFVMVAEYYNPTPVEVPYRGHAGKLFKRDFAGELMDRHADLKLIDYGFLYDRDPTFPKTQDDINWFLMEKTAR